MTGTLYLVGTPIGNLGDISPRGLETLRTVDFIAAEDTRVTLKLLNHYGIRKPMVSYQEHRQRELGAKILSRLLSGENCALVTDAGMPAISDPGEALVRQCAEAGVTVCAVPGPSAVVTALALSGLPTGRFCFEGFLTVNESGRRARLTELAGETRTIVFYEAPHKLLRTLGDLYAVFGNRELALCREMTKLYEEVIRTTLAEALAYYQDETPKGEYVLVVHGAEEARPQVDNAEALSVIVRYQAEGYHLKEACRLAEKETGVAKNTLYRLALAQKKNETGSD